MGRDIKGKELGTGISQRKNGMYQGRYVDRFGKRRVIYNRDLRELKSSLNSAIYEDKNKLNIVDSKTTLNEWYEKWINVYKENVIRENTKRYYNSMYKNIFPQFLEVYQYQK